MRSRDLGMDLLGWDATLVLQLTLSALNPNLKSQTLNPLGMDLLGRNAKLVLQFSDCRTLGAGHVAAFDACGGVHLRGFVSVEWVKGLGLVVGLRVQELYI